MRFAATVLLWLFTTAALAVAVPAVWTQLNIVDVDGYAALARGAAADPSLRAAAASELGSKATALISDRGYQVNSQLVHRAATAYTAGPAFGPQFAQANRLAHDWMFSGAKSGPWVVDLAPMLNDEELQRVLSEYHVHIPSTATVPVTVSAPKTLQPGKLRPMATWGPWVSIAAVALTVICALLTLAAARGRGRALTSLGVSALLVGAAGWAAIEIARSRVDAALNHTVGAMRQIADVMVDYGEASLHHWLNLTLAAGAALVVLGVLVAVLGSLRRA